MARDMLGGAGDSQADSDVNVITLPAIPAGNNNIGDVDVVTLPAIPTGTNTIGGVTLPRSSTVTTSGAHTTSGTPSTATQVVAANANRLQIDIVNDSDTVVYLHLGTTGGAVNSGIRLNANGGAWSSTFYTGAIRSICTAASKVLTVAEVG
jgi:hypothetical protein